MKIGDKFTCTNGKTYTLGETQQGYSFSIIDDEGEIVNEIMDYVMRDAINSEYELHVGEGGWMDWLEW